MSDMVCEEIRNRQNCVPIKYTKNREAVRFDCDVPGQIFVRANPKAKNWWDLDDLIKAVVHDQRVYVATVGWCAVRLEVATYIVAAFAAIGQVEHLEFMAVDPERRKTKKPRLPAE